MALSEKLHEKIKSEILEIAENINEIVSSYKKLKNPLMESQEKVPQATEHLDKINEQTEAATQKMLDILETVMTTEEDILNGLKSVKDELSRNDNGDIAGRVDDIIVKVSKNNNDIFTIMDALQFQDITSQQLNYAVHMLVELESKLNKVLVVMNGDGEVDDKAAKNEDKPRAYDPHADMNEKKTEQSDIDNLFAKQQG